MYTIFMRMSARIFGFAMLVDLPLLMPVNYYGKVISVVVFPPVFLFFFFSTLLPDVLLRTSCKPRPSSPSFLLLSSTLSLQAWQTLKEWSASVSAMWPTAQRACGPTC